MASRDERRHDGGGSGDAQGWDPMHYGHPRMRLEDRAKIFMPFDPLKGFRDELARRERLVEERQRHEPSLPEDEVDGSL